MNNFEIIMLCSVIFFWFMFFITAVFGVITMYFAHNPVSKNRWGITTENHRHYNKSFWCFVMLMCMFVFSVFLMVAVTS